MFRKTVTILFVLFLAVGVFFTSAAGADAVTDGEVSGVVQCTYGTAIAGADVALIDIDAQEITAQTQADDSGAFAFDVTAGGDYMVAAVADGFEGAVVAVAADELIVELAPVLLARGRAVAPMSGPSLLLVFPLGNIPAGIEAMFDGVPMNWNVVAFELNVATTAAGTLAVAAPGFRTYTREVNMAGRPFAVEQTPELEPLPALTVEVRCYFLGTPIEGALVDILGHFSNVPTDRYGIATFDLSPGIYNIIVNATGYATQWRPAVSVPTTNHEPVLFELVPNVPIEDIPIPPETVVAFIYSRFTGARLPDARVYLHTLNGDLMQDASVVTDERGRAIFRDVPQGEFLVVAHADGYDTSWSCPTAPAIVTGDAGGTVSLVLYPSWQFGGTVGRGGAPWWWYDATTVAVGAGDICLIAHPWPTSGPSSPWAVHRDDVHRIIFKTEVTAGLSLRTLFSNLNSLESIEGLENLDTSSVTNMNHMFFNTARLFSLEFPANFNTSNVTDMGAMFAWSRVSELDLSGFNTSNVTNMGLMFWQATQLRSINLSSFNTSNVTRMGDMFARTHWQLQLDLGVYFEFFNQPHWPQNAGLPWGWIFRNDELDMELTGVELMDQFDGSTMAGTWHVVWSDFR